MDNTYLMQLISDLDQRIRDYQNQVELKVIERASYIVQVGALTVTTDVSGVVSTQNVYFPTQFIQKAVNEISNITFRNGEREEIFPKIYSNVEWYSKKLTELKEIYNHIDSILNTNND